MLEQQIFRASLWIDPLSPRPLWLDCPASEATQGEFELQGEFLKEACSSIRWQSSKHYRS